MRIQTLKLGNRKFVVVPEQDFRRLQAEARGPASPSKTRSVETTSAEDRRDGAILRRRLAEMRRRGENPMPYAQARKELGLT